MFGVEGCGGMEIGIESKNKMTKDDKSSGSLDLAGKYFELF